MKMCIRDRDPVVGKLAATGTLGLGDLIFVVGEDQILAAAMNINAFPQMLAGHGGAFDVPAWASLAPGAFPVGFSILFLLPESKIQRTAFFVVHIDTRAGFQIVDGLLGELSVVVKMVDLIEMCIRDRSDTSFQQTARPYC